MFIVSQFGHEEDRSWHVSYDEETVHLGCSCLKMQGGGPLINNVFFIKELKTDPLFDS